VEAAVRQFLRERRIEVTRETGRGELNARCPFPDHNDAHASWSINAESGLWKCMGCGRSGSFEYLYAMLLGVDIWAALGQIREKYDVDIHRVVRLRIAEHGVSRSVFETKRDLEILYGMMERLSEPHPYYIMRGFDNWSWREWEGRFDRDRGMIVFPVRALTGGMRALAGRAVSEKLHHWYEGSEPTTTLYGMHHCQHAREEVVVCEGLLDVHRLRSVLRSEAVDVVSLTTASMSREQEALLSAWDVVSLWLDNDTAGIDAQARMAKRLSDGGKRVNLVPYYTTGKDQADKEVSDAALLAGFRNRRSYVADRVARRVAGMD